MTNCPSNTYPSDLSRENSPRESIVGGYASVIDNATCIAWGSRILNEPLNPDRANDSLGALYMIMKKVKPYRARFIMFSPECYKQYMVETQSALGQPHLMDGKEWILN
jgi:hypothetical protein